MNKKYQNISKIIILFLVSFSCSMKADVENDLSSYQITPKPDFIEVKKGRFVIDDKLKINSSDNLDNETSFLKEIIESITGKVVKNRGGKIINLIIDEKITNKEAYELLVSIDEVTVRGKNASGVFFGVQTLRQLINKEKSYYYLPAVTLKDSPRFKYRGLHLDVGRHFYPVSTVKKYINLMSIHKMNYFHFHLTEDQGWRVEIKKYPKLTSIGSKRNGTIVANWPGTGNDNKVHEGFYTQEEIKDIVKYASDRHITVIPEIEMPGHSSAAIAAYPYLSCFPEEKSKVPYGLISDKSKKEQAEGRIKIVQESWGVYKDVYIPTDRTFAFLEDVLTEVMELFPSKYIHIGGDECPKDYWKKSKFCQELIKKENLKDEHSLQSYFIQRIEKFLNSKGRTIIGWDEILEGGLAPNAIVMSWRGETGGIEASKAHHEVIMTPSSYMYFDHYQAKPIEEEPLAIGGFTSIKEVYNSEPIPKELTKDEEKYVLGVQANLWTEYISTEKKLEYMLIPRIAALSELQWTEKEQKDWKDFKDRLPKMTAMYKYLGYNQAKPYFKE